MEKDPCCVLTAEGPLPSAGSAGFNCHHSTRAVNTRFTCSARVVCFRLHWFSVNQYRLYNCAGCPVFAKPEPRGALYTCTLQSRELAARGTGSFFIHSKLKDTMIIIIYNAMAALSNSN